MRSYKAARRRAQKQPVEFDFVFERRVEQREGGELIGVDYVETTQHFVCYGEVNTLLLSELAYNADLDVADPEAMKLIRNFFAQAFGDSEEGRAGYTQFFKLQTQYGDDDLLMEIMAGLVEDFSARPTRQLSPSPEQPSLSGDVSKVVSFSRGTVEVVEGEVAEATEEPGAASS